MNALVRIDPLAIPVEQIDATIAALVALRLKPSRSGYAWYRALVTFDAIEGCDALLEAISNAEDDIGLGDAHEPIGDDRQHDEGWTFGLYNGELDLCPTSRVGPTSVAA